MTATDISQGMESCRKGRIVTSDHLLKTYTKPLAICMDVRVHVGIYVCMHLDVCMCVYIFDNLYIYIYAQLHMLNANAHNYVCVYIGMYGFVCTCILYRYVRGHACMCQCM